MLLPRSNPIHHLAELDVRCGIVGEMLSPRRGIPGLLDGATARRWSAWMPKDAPACQINQSNVSVRR